MSTEEPWVVMGAGAWGTAMAIHLAQVHSRVVLVPRDEAKAQLMREKRENTVRLPGVPFPENLIVDTHYERYLQPNSVVFLACSTKGLVPVCEQLKPFRFAIGISLMKGLELVSLKTPLQFMHSLLPTINVGVLSGPTYALDFAKGSPSAMVLSAMEDAHWLQKPLSNERVRVYYNSDWLGVELGGGLKNVYSVGAGILDALQLGDNARAAYLTRSLKEMVDLGVLLGGQATTFYGLSGLGDLLASAQGKWGRNHRFGFMFAQGHSIASLLRYSTVEGYGSIQRFHERIQGSSIEAPILSMLHAVFYEQMPISEAIRAFFMRPLKDEH